MADLSLLEKATDELIADIEEGNQECEIDCLQEIVERFRQTTENALAMIWEVDATGKYVYVSSACQKVFGLTSNEVLGKYFYDFFYPDIKEKLKNDAFEVFAKKESFRQFVNKNVRNNGKVMWLSTSGVPLINKNGELIGYRGVDIDISALCEHLLATQEKLNNGTE